MKNKLYISIILIAAIVLILNIISQDFFVRLDFSGDKEYTLSKATKNILKDLKEPVTIKAYFSENLPPEIAKGKNDFKDLLIEYTNRSKGMLVYEFIDPSKKEEIEQEANQAGIRPVMINVREKDQIKQQKAYLGAVISMGDKKEVIPVIQAGTAIEYSISSAIKKLSVEKKPTIGLLQGHGEPGLQEVVQAYNELDVLYNVQPLTLTDTTTIPADYKTIMIVRPTDSIKASHLAQLDQFLARGGRLMIALQKVKIDNRGEGSAINTGLESWLKRKGITVEDNFVTDARCATVQIPQQQGNIQYFTQLQLPYFPIISNFAKHPATTGLESIILKFPSNLTFSGDSSIKYTPLVFSSDKSGTEKVPMLLNTQKNWTDADFPQKNLVLGAAFEGKFSGNERTKMIVIANGDFIVSSNEDRGQVQPDNINLFVNSVDWLSDDTGLIELRTKSVTARPLKDLSDGTKATLKWVNFLLPVLLVLIYGIFRAQMNRNIRIKRMEDSYV
jgi:gliding-associated putative ABC transporter substrate-binding component GldG